MPVGPDQCRISRSFFSRKVYISPRLLSPHSVSAGVIGISVDLEAYFSASQTRGHRIIGQAYFLVGMSLTNPLRNDNSGPTRLVVVLVCLYVVQVIVTHQKYDISRATLTHSVHAVHLRLSYSSSAQGTWSMVHESLTHSPLSATYQSRRTAWVGPIMTHYPRRNAIDIAPDQIHTMVETAMKTIYDQAAIKSRFYADVGSRKEAKSTFKFLIYPRCGTDTEQPVMVLSQPEACNSG